MKVKQLENEKPKVFEPIRLELLIENEKDLRNLNARLVVYKSEILDSFHKKPHINDDQGLCDFAKLLSDIIESL